MGEDEYDLPTILGRPFLSNIKAIIYIGTREVHMYFPFERRRQIIKNGWVDYEGKVIRTEDIQLEQNCPEEAVAPSQVWREKIGIHEERRHRNHRLRHLANPRTTDRGVVRGSDSSIDSYIVPLSCIGLAEEHYYRGVIAMFLIFLDNITMHGRSPVSQ